jgi:hypothetical protein
MVVIDPPKDYSKKKVYKKTPLELFIKATLSENLNAGKQKRLVEILRKLPWDQTIEQEIWIPESDREQDVPAKIKKVEVNRLLLDSFTKPWKVNFDGIVAFADVVQDLSKERPDFGIHVVDEVVETIYRYAEDDLNFNIYQRWTLMIRYLGELFLRDLVLDECMMTVLYALLFHAAAPFDLDKNHIIRFRLVGTLFSTCGRWIRLDVRTYDAVNKFLQLYQLALFIKTGGNDLPRWALDLLDEIWTSANIQLRRFVSLSDAKHAMERISSPHAQWLLAQCPKEFGSQEDATKDDELEKIEHDDLADEFDKVMKESIDSRKQEKQVMLDISIPMISKEETETGGTVNDSETMPFAILARGKSSKNLKTIDVPLDSSIAQSNLQHRHASQQQREELKRLVLRSVQ